MITKNINYIAKTIVSLIIVLALFACNSGSGSVPVTSTTNAPPGALLSAKSITVYPTTNLRDFLLGQICFGVGGSVCEDNQTHLVESYNFALDRVESIESNVEAYALTYSSPGVANENRLSSGGLLIPDVESANQIKGIILYYHGTSVTKSDVPSCFGGTGFDKPLYCQSSSLEGQIIGAILASQGYIVVMPDYVGQGIDNHVVHPYTFYPQNNAENGINMLTAVRTFLRQLDFPESSPLNLYITGVSEGGAYALWTSKLIQTDYASRIALDKFKLISTAPISGAYDLTNAQMPMEVDNVAENDNSHYNILNTFTATSAKPVLMAYALTAYGFYNLNQTYTTVMNPQFFDCLTCKISGYNYNMASLFNTANLDDPSIKAYISSAAGLTGYGVNDNNSVKALTASGLENNGEFKAQLAKASLASFNSTTPISLIYLAKDSIVTNLNSVNAYTGIRGATPDSTRVEAKIVINDLYKYKDVQGSTVSIDHQQSTPFMLIAALAALQESGESGTL